jgi:hypothetical protein
MKAVINAGERKAATAQHKKRPQRSYRVVKGQIDMAAIWLRSPKVLDRTMRLT